MQNHELDFRRPKPFTYQIALSSGEESKELAVLVDGLKACYIVKCNRRTVLRTKSYLKAVRKYNSIYQNS